MRKNQWITLHDHGTNFFNEEGRKGYILVRVVVSPAKFAMICLSRYEAGHKQSLSKVTVKNFKQFKKYGINDDVFFDLVSDISDKNALERLVENMKKADLAIDYFNETKNDPKNCWNN